MPSLQLSGGTTENLAKPDDKNVRYIFIENSIINLQQPLVRLGQGLALGQAWQGRGWWRVLA